MTNAPHEAGRSDVRHATSPEDSVAATPDTRPEPIGYAWFIDAGDFRRVVGPAHLAAATAAAAERSGHQVTVTRVALVPVDGARPPLHRCGRPRRDGRPCLAPVPGAGDVCRLHR